MAAESFETQSQGPTTWLYSVMYRTSLMLMKFTRPSASNFLAFAGSSFSWCLSACINITAIVNFVLETPPCVSRIMEVCGGEYLSEKDNCVRRQAIVCPHFFHSTNGYRDSVNSLCSCNQFLIAVALLSLGSKERDLICLFSTILIHSFLKTFKRHRLFFFAKFTAIL